MASTQNLQNTLNWCQPFISNLPMFIQPGMEPAVTCANMVLQTILGPPFAWRWNRNTTSFTAVVGNSDNVKTGLTDFGRIERVYTTIGSTPKNREITKFTDIMAPPTETDVPDALCVANDDDAGNITFRSGPAYDQTYAVTVVYQKKPVLFSSLASFWAPVPDELGYIYNWGFLALAMMFNDDPRYAATNQKFVGCLLAHSEGLTEEQKSLFIDAWMNMGLRGGMAQQRMMAGDAGRKV